MRLSTAFKILKILQNTDITTCKKIALELEINLRTVHRYLDELTINGIPIQTKKGKNGGIFITAEYKKGSNTLLKYVR